MLTQLDFDSPGGQQKIIEAFHKLERRVHELEIIQHELTKQLEHIEQELKGPEAY